MIEPACFRVGVDLAVPCVVEINFGQLLEKLALLGFWKLFNGINDFCDRAHTEKSSPFAFEFLIETCSLLLS